MTESNIVVDTDAVSFLFRGDSREEFYLPFILKHRSVICGQIWGNANENWHMGN